QCLACLTKNTVYDFKSDGISFFYCKDCGHIFTPDNQTMLDFQKGCKNSDFNSRVQEFLSGLDKECFKEILYIGKEPLNVPSNFNLKQIEAKALEDLDKSQCFDICIFNDILSAENAPIDFMHSVWKVLKDGALCFFYSFSRGIQEYKERVSNKKIFKTLRKNYFDSASIENILCRSGFGAIAVSGIVKDGVFVKCRKVQKRDIPLLSIIIPVFNEEKTVLELLTSVYNKKLQGIDKEMIIVESASLDKTRQIVCAFSKQHPEIKLILEDRPRGKGCAVRAGFKAASGDFILIQDGDLEYDVNDYDLLLQPLINYQRGFVLGSRWTGTWKIRNFSSSNKLESFYVNFGHIFFASIINFICKTKVKDPFTMYKVFRKECLYGLEFDGKRFELDIEIMIKLARKRYKPIEIPINYSSRGFSEGKKIRKIVDPLILIKGFVRYGYLYKIDIK
ncbi:MAG: glycosyltransferase family 2 protein, partial [Elusimicrobiota bacterium]|nr:glycosyltransferase family 2 protein [Elusimicrobiota bacterium]